MFKPGDQVIRVGHDSCDGCIFEGRVYVVSSVPDPYNIVLRGHITPYDTRYFRLFGSSASENIADNWSILDRIFM